MVLCFIDIGGIVDRHCLTFLFITTHTDFNLICHSTQSTNLRQSNVT